MRAYWVWGVVLLVLLSGCDAQRARGERPVGAAGFRLYFPVVTEQRAPGQPSTSTSGPLPTLAPSQPAPATSGPLPTPAPAACPEGCAASSPGCLIKATVILSGERVYYLPGWKLYADTVVDPRFGDRWFCTTAEAEANGWHPSDIR